MKVILISIKPEWVSKILNREKTIEIRKTMPNCDLPIDVYIYCTKNGGAYGKTKNQVYTEMNGKVVAKFTLNKVEEVKPLKHKPSLFCPYDWLYCIVNDSPNNLKEKSCLGFNELHAYFQGKNGYAWHIDNLVIFDKPKELSEFYDCQIGWNNCIPHNCNRCACSKPLIKAPQSYSYVEVKK